ncbi:hypothetical protein [Streptomyces sp. NPDC055085]
MRGYQEGNGGASAGEGNAWRLLSEEHRSRLIITRPAIKTLLHSAANRWIQLPGWEEPFPLPDTQENLDTLLTVPVPIEIRITDTRGQTLTIGHNVANHTIIVTGGRVAVTGGRVAVSGGTVTTVSGGMVGARGSVKITTVAGGRVFLYETAVITTVIDGEVEARGNSVIGTVTVTGGEVSTYESATITHDRRPRKGP